jgi:bidirectional [NiFe] hydrogenase diaphorase subunit
VVTLIVDNKEIETQEGATLLQACLDNGIYIPNLCYLRGMEYPPASCRLCFVEIEGFDEPRTSCRIRAQQGMVVRTNTERVRRLQKTAFELLLSTHHVDCRNCPANKKCELQKIAKFLHFGLKLKRLEALERDIEIGHEHPFLEYVPTRCVLCGKCVFVCRETNGRSILSFAKRGLNTVISFFGQESNSMDICKECYACAEICPVAALLVKDGLNQSNP